MASTRPERTAAPAPRDRRRPDRHKRRRMGDRIVDRAPLPR